MEDNSEFGAENSQDQCAQDILLCSDEVDEAMEGSDINKHKESVVDVWRWKNSSVNDIQVERRHNVGHTDPVAHSSDSAERDMTESNELLQSRNNNHSCSQKIHLNRSNTTKNLSCTNTDTSNHSELKIENMRCTFLLACTNRPCNDAVFPITQMSLGFSLTHPAMLL